MKVPTVQAIGFGKKKNLRDPGVPLSSSVGSQRKYGWKWIFSFRPMLVLGPAETQTLPFILSTAGR